MDKKIQDIGKRAVKRARNEAVDDRVVSPLARKAGGCATVFFIILFSALGIYLAILISKTGGNADKAGPLAIGIGIVAGIIIGAVIGNLIGKVMRRLLIK